MPRDLWRQLEIPYSLFGYSVALVGFTAKSGAKTPEYIGASIFSLFRNICSHYTHVLLLK